jgi:hypothetical protein
VAVLTVIWAVAVAGFIRAGAWATEDSQSG